MNAKLILSLEDIPDAESDPGMHSSASNKSLQGLLVFQVLNEIRKYDPESLTNRQCALVLAKAKALIERIDLLANVSELTKKEEHTTEEMP
jgi:hypothetical protein